MPSDWWRCSRRAALSASSSALRRLRGLSVAASGAAPRRAPDRSFLTERVALPDLSLRDLEALQLAVLADADRGRVVEVHLMETDRVIFGGIHDVNGTVTRPKLMAPLRTVRGMADLRDKPREGQPTSLHRKRHTRKKA